ncbi:MAG TPA: lytic murein transglycosylase [Solirubrobacteraceae bacterium]
MAPEPRPSRARVAATLCIAGAIAVGFGGTVLVAGAQTAAIAEPSTATVPADPTPAPDPPANAGTTSTTSTIPDTTTTTPGTTTTVPPSGGGEPAAGPASPTGGEPAHRGPADAAAPSASSAVEPLPGEPQAPALLGPPRAGSPPTPLPLGQFAGPAAPAAIARECRRTVARQAADRKRARSSARNTRRAVVRCETAAAAAANTILSKRGDTPRRALRDKHGVPTTANPSVSLAVPGAVPVGVPDFFIEKFRIPPFLLPIYQAAGTEFGVRWEVLAAINEIETDYGRNLDVSSAGALGWMQFLPQTWALYGTDANRDGRSDPFNPVDAIFAAARYLKAAGADQDLRKAIFAYNHADWYVESVLMRARLIAGLPADLVGSLSGLTQGRFPVVARARYADDVAERRAAARAAARTNAAAPAASEPRRRGIDIFAAAGAPVIAVQDAAITAVGESRRLGRYVQLRDVYGNTYTYAQLEHVAARVPVPKAATQRTASIAGGLQLPADPAPARAASAGSQAPAAAATAVEVFKQRLFAHPARPRALANGGATQIFESGSALPAGRSLDAYIAGPYALDTRDVVLKPLAAGRRVIAGTILGRIGTTTKAIAPRLHFEIRPAGRGAPRIDPKPILDGWKLLESTAIYRARGQNPLTAPGASIGQIMLMSKEALVQRVLANPRIELYPCGRRDIEAGMIDRRVLATLEFLAASGLKPTVTSLTCGHGYYTAGGNVSEHSSGNAVDIGKVNDIPILGHQGDSSIADITIRRLLTLQGITKPHQIISLMTYAGTDNTLALRDHADHIHVGFQPRYEPGTPQARQYDAMLRPNQWIKLIDRLGHIDNPTIDPRPSTYAIPVPATPASLAHRGE